LKTKIELEAAESTLTPEVPLTHATDRRRMERAYLAGAKALKRHLDSEVRRLVGIVTAGNKEMRSSEFEKGQLDGILWLQSCMEELFVNE
jgi:hypothetical protein